MEHNYATNDFIGIGHQSDFKTIKCEWEIMVFGAGHHKSDEQLNITNGKSTANFIRYQTNHKYGCIR